MEILNKLREYEKRHNVSCYITLFSCGGGMVLDEDDLMIFSFSTYDELILLLSV